MRTHHVHVVATLTGVVLALAAATLATPVAASATCTDVSLVGAAGSGELEAAKHPQATGYLGSEVQFMAERIARRIGRYGMTFSAIGVRYPADSVAELWPHTNVIDLLNPVTGNVARAITAYSEQRDVRKYFASIRAGTAAVIRQAAADLRMCPSTTLVLAGYSQGAMAVHQAELQMPSSIRAHIGGTLLLADGDRRPNSASRLFGTASNRGEGIRSYLKLNNGRDMPLPRTTADICADRDLVCDPDWKAFKHLAQSTKIHTGYLKGRSGLLASASEWVADNLGRQFSRSHILLGLPLDRFAKGWGTPHPETIFNGGDETGQVEHITWSNWGGPTATGTGTGWWVWPGLSVASGGNFATATIVATDITTCNGFRIYNSVSWFFPDYGETYLGPDTGGGACNPSSAGTLPGQEKCAATVTRPSSEGETFIATEITAWDGVTCSEAESYIENSALSERAASGEELKYEEDGYRCGSQGAFLPPSRVQIPECRRGNGGFAFTLEPV